MTATVTKETALPFRNDTILGVCEALGQDFGVNPIWFRLAFIAPLFFQPMLTIAAYLGLGVIVAASRWLFPRAAAAPQRVEAPATAPLNNEQEDYRIAA